MTSPRTKALLNIGPYQLTQKVGSGGMGAVYRATDSRDGRVVALKLMHEHVASDPNYAERFRREAAVAALIDSPNVVRVLEFAADGGRPYIVTEFVDGPSVEQLLHSGALRAEEAAAIAAGVANALAEASRRGVVHRDIKPANILIGPDGVPKVTDFGIATINHSSSLTMPGMFVGTAAYAAPEQHRGEADTRSDIYSLGVVLFEMLAGALPFQAETATGMMRQHEDARPPLERLSGQPKHVVAAVSRCLEKSPGRRFQQPGDLVAALQGQPDAERASAGDTVLAVASIETFGPGATVVDQPCVRQTGAHSGVAPGTPFANLRQSFAEMPLVRKAAAAAVVVAVVTAAAMVSFRGSSADSGTQYSGGGSGGNVAIGGATETGTATTTAVPTLEPGTTPTVPGSPTRPPKQTTTVAPSTPTQAPPPPTTVPTKTTPPPTQPPAPALHLSDWAFCHTTGCPYGDEELYSGYAIAVVFELSTATSLAVSAEVWFDGVYQYTSTFTPSANGLYYDVLPWANYSGPLELAIYVGGAYVGSAETWVY